MYQEKWSENMEPSKRKDMLSFAEFMQTYAGLILDPRKHELPEAPDFFSYCDHLIDFLKEARKRHLENILREPSSYPYWNIDELIKNERNKELPSSSELQ